MKFFCILFFYAVSCIVVPQEETAVLFKRSPAEHRIKSPRRLSDALQSSEPFLPNSKRLKSHDAETLLESVTVFNVIPFLTFKDAIKLSRIGISDHLILQYFSGKGAIHAFSYIFRHIDDTKSEISDKETFSNLKSFLKNKNALLELQGIYASRSQAKVKKIFREIFRTGKVIFIEELYQSAPSLLELDKPFGSFRLLTESIVQYGHADLARWYLDQTDFGIDDILCGAISNDQMNVFKVLRYKIITFDSEKALGIWMRGFRCALGVEKDMLLPDLIDEISEINHDKNWINRLMYARIRAIFPFSQNILETIIKHTKWHPNSIKSLVTFMSRTPTYLLLPLGRMLLNQGFTYFNTGNQNPIDASLRDAATRVTSRKMAYNLVFEALLKIKYSNVPLEQWDQLFHEFTFKKVKIWGGYFHAIQLSQNNIISITKAIDSNSPSQEWFTDLLYGFVSRDSSSLDALLRIPLRRQVSIDGLIDLISAAIKSKKIQNGKRLAQEFLNPNLAFTDLDNSSPIDIAIQRLKSTNDRGKNDDLTVLDILNEIRRGNFHN